MKKAAFIIFGTIGYYFITVLVLLILTIIFNDSFENIWVSAIPVTILAELLLLVYWIWKKVKHQSLGNSRE